MKKESAKESIAERTRSYIDSHPSIKDCIAKDLVNFSSLARLIMKEVGIKNEEAVMIACRRYAARLGRQNHEKEILKVLGDSRLEVKTKICIVTAKNDWTVLHRLEAVFRKLINEKAIMQVIQSAQALTIIADEKLKSEVVDTVGKENVLKVRQDLVELSVKSPEVIVDTSGVYAHLVSSLAEGGVNIVETASCYTDTIFILDEADMIEAYSILSRCIQSAEDVNGSEEE